MFRVQGKKINAISYGANIIIYVIAGIVALTTIWPIIYVASMSVSDPNEVMKQSVWLFPKGFNLDSYMRIFNNMMLWRSYANTVFYVLTGTFFSSIISLLGAYPLARKRLFGRKIITRYLIIPMYFSGGLIPLFIIYSNLGLYNNFLVMIIPGMVSIWNIILVRTYFVGLPFSLQESAFIDGASDIKILFSIMAPLSKPIIAVISLYTAVGIWNSWFNALVFLPDTKWHPLQLFLARVLIFDTGELKGSPDPTRTVEKLNSFALLIQLKYAVIIFATLPIICTYPFLQKYFIKGVLLGSLKE